MTALGVPWHWIAAAGAVSGTALVALAFLRPRSREHVVPSIMLWLDAAESIRPRVLWRKFSRPLSLLTAALAVLFMLLALAEPVLELPSAAPPKRHVVVFSPGAFAEAQTFAEKLDPLRTALIRAEAGGEVVNDFGSPMRRFSGDDASGQAPDWHEVTVLAQKLAGSDGSVHVFAASPPPQLPENALFHRIGVENRRVSSEPLTVFPADGSARGRELLACLPGTTVAADRKCADLVCDTSADRNELERRLHASETYMAESSGQASDVSSVPPEGPRFPARRLGTVFAVLALIAAVIDFLLWQRRKIV